MTRTATWVLTLGSIFSLVGACATGSGEVGGPGGEPSTDTGGSNSGGTGGSSTGGTGTGASPSTGGTGGTGGTSGTGGSTSVVCTLGESVPCNEIPSVRNSFPLGEAECVETASGSTALNLGTCRLCEPGEKEECVDHDVTRPEGDAVCAPDGRSWSLSACRDCTVGTQKACEDLSASRPIGTATCLEEGGFDIENDCFACDVNSTDTKACAELDMSRPVGEAICLEGDWDSSTCLVCEPNSTKSCVGIETKYTGGQATCNAQGTGYDESACEWCGNGEVEAGEVCEPSLGVPTGLTCESAFAGQFPGIETPVTKCNTSCQYDVAQCSLCPGKAAAECLEGGSCKDSACANKECAPGKTCDFGCSNWQSSCPGMACVAGSTCNFTCPGGDSTCAVLCPEGANCTVKTGQHNAHPSGSIVCGSGNQCDVEIVGSQLDIEGLDITCKAGSTCTLKTSGWQSNLMKPMVCEAGSTCTLTCEAGTTCKYKCAADATCTCTGEGCSAQP